MASTTGMRTAAQRYPNHAWPRASACRCFAARLRGAVTAISPWFGSPRYYFCPECRRLDVWKYFDTSKKSPRCPTDGHVVVPSRFVVACEFGHISDFPYYQWAHSQQQPGSPGVKHSLTLVTRGETSSLSDIEVGCSCGARRTMEGSLRPKR